MATRHRPSRGKAGPEIELGDPFGQYEKQGGEAPGASESGDLQSREFGVPQADIPGGVNHLVNEQAKPVKPVHHGERPADAHKYHGVPPMDDGLYTKPGRADEQERDHQKPPPVRHKYSEAVPVSIVEDPERPHVRRTSVCYSVNIAAGNPATGSNEPTRICNRDDDRVSIQVLNEDSSTDIRISEDYNRLLTQSAQGTGPAGAGSLIWHGTNSYTRLETQEPLWGITTGAASARLSVIITTEVAEA